METDLTAGVPHEPPEPLQDAPAAVGDVLLDGSSVSEIHRGGQAWVLVVDDTEQGNRRAIKIPRSGALTGDAELATLLGLEPHPHVVTTLDVTEVSGRRGIVLEYAPATLADLLHGQLLTVSLRPSGDRRAGLAETGAPPWLIPRAEVLQEICDGMAYLSKAGEFAHLDLKPSNVLIDGAGHAKIADFGLSQRVRTRDGRYSPAPGGTWAYAAPEVIQQKPCDSRADIFSFGVLLYQACTGKLPYPFPLASTPNDQRAQMLDYYESPGPKDRTKELFYWGQFTPTQVPVALSNENISEIISSCLQKDMHNRPPSFRRLGEMLTWELGIPQVRAETFPLPEIDRQRRELALSQALVRIGRVDEAVRRLNRLLSTSLPPVLSTEVLHAAREALTAAGRPGDAAALEGWR
ncbi:MAG: serine/threonine-protein kinase [Pseudonocardiaceae bacterium]